MHYLIVVVWLLLIAPPALADKTAAPSLAEFAAKLQPLTQNRTVQAEYRQNRNLKSMNFTFEIRGYMYQEHGRRLAWATSTPLRSVCIFSVDSFKQWDAETNKVTSLSASEMPWLKMIFEYQVKWLSGDLEALTADFTITPLDSHTLRLAPKRQEFTLFFSELEIRFRPGYDALEQILFREKNGDSMTLEFFNIKNNAAIPEQIWALPPK